MTGALPEVALPSVTADQMREVDRVMVDELGIALIQMMENAGRALADLAILRYRPARAVVLAGPGGNGGGGLVAARHLANRGVEVSVTLSSAGTMTGVPAHQLDIVRRMALEVRDGPSGGDVVIDALIGYSLRGDPRGRAAALIDWANDRDAPVLSLDAPSGLDVTTARAGEPCVAADATLTLALPKVGMRDAPTVGALFAADISVPAAVYAGLGVPVGAPFAGGGIVRVVA